MQTTLNKQTRISWPENENHSLPVTPLMGNWRVHALPCSNLHRTLPPQFGERIDVTRQDFGLFNLSKAGADFVRIPKNMDRRKQGKRCGAIDGSTPILMNLRSFPKWNKACEMADLM
jgi:hypothetical protein